MTDPRRGAVPLKITRLIVSLSHSITCDMYHVPVHMRAPPCTQPTSVHFCAGIYEVHVCTDLLVEELKNLKVRN